MDYGSGSFSPKPIMPGYTGHSSSFRASNGISSGQELVKSEKQQNETIVKSWVLYTSCTPVSSDMTKVKSMWGWMRERNPPPQRDMAEEKFPLREENRLKPSSPCWYFQKHQRCSCSFVGMCWIECTACSSQTCLSPVCLSLPFHWREIFSWIPS